MSEELLNIPITMTFRKTAELYKKIDAQYAQVSTKVVANLLLKAYEREKKVKMIAL